MLKTSSVNLGRYLRQCREKRSLSQAQVAKQLNYSTPQFVSNWERGISAPPTETLRVLINIYRIPKEEFFDFLLEEQSYLLQDILENSA